MSNLGEKKPNSENSNRFRAPPPDHLRREIDLSLGDIPSSFELMEKTLESIRTQSVSTHSPYFMNQLFSGVSPETKLAENFLTEIKTTMATYEVSPVLTVIEKTVIESLGHLFGWTSNETDGVAVPGGSAGNFMALHCARQKSYPDLRKTGLIGHHRFRVFTSKESHYSLKKACVVLGLGEDALIQVDVDKLGRMCPKDLETKIEQEIQLGATPLMINVTSGTTVLGSFDPINEISKVSQKYNLWLHLDSAWGGPAIFHSGLKKYFDGSESADSISFDAHKLLGATLTSSFFLTRHPKILLEANDVSGGDYLFHQDEPIWDLGKKSWQCGRRPEAFLFWILWKTHGANGFQEMIERLISVRDQSVTWIKKQGRLELVADPQFLNVCVRVVPPNQKVDPSWSKRVRNTLRDQDIAFVNFSTDEKGSFLRLIFAHPKIKFEHVQHILSQALEVT